MQFGKWSVIIVTGILTLFAIILPKTVSAAENSFVTIVQPVRGQEFWQTPGQTPASAVSELYKAIAGKQLIATWLLRYDALINPEILLQTNSFDKRHELGAFLEVTPGLARAAGVTYNQSPAWHLAQSVLLIGYQPQDRKKLIDAYFTKFKATFGVYPLSVGAWWIDANSLTYMQEKYGVTASLIVADQYSTDNYQIWGQYWSSPYYPSKTNTLTPAKTADKKIPLVITQWAARDPYNGYGNGVYDSTYSVQANDYMPFHNLTTEYFTKLVDIYTKPIGNQYGFLTVGIENDYSLTDFGPEFQKQLDVLADKQQKGQFRIVTQKDFSAWYKTRFPGVTEPRVIAADDPLGYGGKVTWFQNTNYRVGWFYNSEKGSYIRDLRPYVEDTKEPCLYKACTELNFATSATRVLDEVTFGEQALIDGGQITNVSQTLSNGIFKIAYTAASTKNREIIFTEHDISIDSQTKTIDTFILDTRQQLNSKPKMQLAETTPQRQVGAFISAVIKFMGVGLLLFFFSVWWLTSKLFKNLEPIEQWTLTVIFGMAATMLLAYIGGFFNLPTFIMPLLLLLIGLVSAVAVIRNGVDIQQWKQVITRLKQPRNYGIALLIAGGSALQVLPVIKSGWESKYGFGFWGPNGHDAIWHLALIEQLTYSVPPENPIYGGEPLRNYHYFYDLLLAAFSNISAISVSDLYFRLFPVLFSVLFGILVFLWVKRLTQSYMAAALAIIFAYTAGSFGYIVTILHGRGIFGGGESAFWANQAVSFHLNEPYALSAVMILAACLILWQRRLLTKLALILTLAIIAGVIIEVKVYAGILLIGALGAMGLYEAITLRKYTVLKASLATVLISLLVFLPNNSGASSLIIFSPFWFIHSMAEAGDRVDWKKLVDARLAYFDRKEWLKLGIVEAIGLTLFWLGNLGMRFVGIIGGLTAIISAIKKRSMPSEYVFLATFIALSMMIPLFFIQKATAWNTIQFIYYGLLMGAILTGVTLNWIIKHTKVKPIGYGIVIIIFVLSIPTTLDSVRTYFSERPPATLPQAEHTALKFLAQQPYGMVVTYPYDEKLNTSFDPPMPLYAYTSTAYVSAFSQKPVFLENLGNNDIIGQEYKGRLAAQKEFFKTRDEYFAKKFITDNRIAYIYLPRKLRSYLDENFYGIEKLYETDDVVIYKTKIAD